MAIKDATPGYDSALEHTSAGTTADRTQYTAEFTDVVNPDGSTQPASHMTYTEIAPDGTETVIEAVVTADGAYIVEDESLLEEAVEAALGVEFEDELTPYTLEQPASDAGANDLQVGSDYQTGSADFTVGEEMFAPGIMPTDATDVSYAQTPVDFAPLDTGFADPTFAEAAPINPAFDSTYANPADTAGTTDFGTSIADSSQTSEDDAAEIADQEAHAQAATEAQAAADEFVAAGDYAAAAEARSVAENESWEAGDDSMLGAYDAQDFTVAAEKQENAAYYSEQQAQYAREGDYEAAREAASKAEYATSDADWRAGGDDHSGQADAEYRNLDNAVWQEGLRDDDLENAAYHAEMGNPDAAEASLGSAAAHQESADYYGDLGEPGNEMAVYDPSAAVETGGSYESSYDTSVAVVDTGFDSSVDTSVDTTSMDMGTSDV